ncbi:MAG TPA: GNAT family N-acetyltransferase [Pilimelia sp.]|nr:GNAT family N-acetyltransferase [Pilimelia sp.]
MSDSGFTLRPAGPNDVGFLTDMLLAAVNWRPGRRVPREEVLTLPETVRYVDGWPRATDLGAVAVDQGGAPVGAAWLRYFSATEPGYGFVAGDVPELSIGVTAAWRGRGVGRELLREVARQARVRGIARVSLSVERANPATRLYLREGYAPVASGPDSVTMVKDLDA